MFPDPEQTDANGLLAMGGDLSVETLEEAYTKGIFPWPQEGYPLLWFCPPKRGVLFFDKFKIPKSTQKVMKQKVFEMTFNKDFRQVIENCAKIPRNHETGTWILPKMVEAYVDLHHMGKAHSVETWSNGELVGGLYGVQFQGVFSGESMFFKQSEASKVCLVELIEKLKSQGQNWLDIQMVTPVLEQMGGEYLPRRQFLDLLKKTQESC